MDVSRHNVIQHPVSFAFSELCLIFCVVAIGIFYIRLRRRSYRGTLILAVVVGSCLSGGLVSAAVIHMVAQSSQMPTPRDSEEWFALGAATFSVFTTAALQLLDRLLPAEGPRNAPGGFRQGWLYLSRSFTAISWLLIGFTLFVGVQILRWPRNSGLYAGAALSDFIGHRHQFRCDGPYGTNRLPL